MNPRAVSKRSASLLVSAANALSLSRLCAVPAVVFLILQSAEVDSYRYGAFWLLVALHAGDMLDGYLGRMGSQRLAVRNHFGEMIDPFADKTYIGAAFITLAVTNQFAAWFVALAVARDAAIILGWTVIYRRCGVRLLPSRVGKVTDAGLVLVLAAVLLRVPGDILAFMTFATAGLIAVSGYSYTRDALRALAVARFRELRFYAKLRRKRVGMAQGSVGPAPSPPASS